MVPKSHWSDFKDFGRNCQGHWPSSQVSHFIDFDKELCRKLFVAVICHISVILIRPCEGNCAFRCLPFSIKPERILEGGQEICEKNIGPDSNSPSYIITYDIYIYIYVYIYIYMYICLEFEYLNVFKSVLLTLISFQMSTQTYLG